MTDPNTDNDLKTAINKSIECCGSCELFAYESTDGMGICQNTDKSTTCDDYCGEWTPRRVFCK